MRWGGGNWEPPSHSLSLNLLGGRQTSPTQAIRWGNRAGFGGVPPRSFPLVLNYRPSLLPHLTLHVFPQDPS